MAERRITIILSDKSQAVVDKAHDLAMGYMTDGGGGDGIYTSFEDWPLLEDVEVVIRGD